MRALVTCGEFYFDFIFYNLPHVPRLGEELLTRNFALALGGGAVITALAAARLGRAVELVSLLGDTPLDSYARAQLRSAGIGAQQVKQVRGYTAGITVSVSVRRDRYFLTYRGANDLLERHALSGAVRARLGRAAHVHFGLTPRRWGPFSRLIRWLGRWGVTTSWDLGWNPAAANQAGFRRACALLNVVFFNRDEALRYSGEATPEAALKRLGRRGQCVVIKLGARGALASGPDGKVNRAQALKVRAIETTGAGDAFNAGFLDAWLDGADLTDCLRAGNVCGALSTTEVGGSAGAPTRAELRRGLGRLT